MSQAEDRGEAPDPIDQFRRWYAEAQATEPGEPTAVALATVDADGAPSVRMVLLKGVSERGFVFYTNFESRKGRALAADPRAALCFYWNVLGYQVRVEGRVETVGADEADAYFGSRERTSQIGAWASRQSRPLAGRWELEKEVARMTAKFLAGKIPRPPFWSGYRLVPERIEFWRRRPFRLHERIVYSKDGGGWTTERLYP